MTPMRKRMIDELELHRNSPRTVEAYVTAAAQLAGHYARSPDRISWEQLHLGRYTHRVTISNHRILDCRDGQVRFS